MIRLLFLITINAFTIDTIILNQFISKGNLYSCFIESKLVSYIIRSWPVFSFFRPLIIKRRNSVSILSMCSTVWTILLQINIVTNGVRRKYLHTTVLDISRDYSCTSGVFNPSECETSHHLSRLLIIFSPSRPIYVQFRRWPPKIFKKIQDIILLSSWSIRYYKATS